MSFIVGKFFQLSYVMLELKGQPLLTTKEMF